MCLRILLDTNLNNYNMSALINVSINLDKLPKQKIVKGKAGTYYNFTLSVNDDTNQYGQNVSVFDSQTKEEREAKKAKDYLGNGQVVWTDGNCTKAVFQSKENNVKSTQTTVSNDLPF
jgi:hypothetical protein